MAAAVHALCAFTALACAAMLGRGYRRNLLLYADLGVIPETSLSTVRSSIALAGLSVLLFGLVWDRP